MFTGIIVGTGKVTKLDQKTKNRSAIQMTVNLGKYAKGLKIGQSVAINGVCLSATKISKNNCIFEMIDETTKKTDLGNVKAGSTVNVERSLKVGDRLEGHFVLGHIDGVATITKIEKKLDYEIDLPLMIKRLQASLRFCQRTFLGAFLYVPLLLARKNKLNQLLL